VKGTTKGGAEDNLSGFAFNGTLCSKLFLAELLFCN